MSTKIKKLLPYLIVFLTGAVGGFCIIVVTPEVGLVMMLAGIICLGICFILHVFIHEAGHLVAGKISGYGFVSIRFFDLMFIRKDGKMIRKKYRIAGTLGQCLMSPPPPVDGKYPFVLYNLGGSLMNFIFSALSMGIYFILPSGSWILMMFAIVGAIVGLLNILPLNLGIPTDGHNAVTLGKNKLAHRTFWTVLNINSLITKGFRYRDIPVEEFNFLDDIHLNHQERNNALVIGVETNKFEWLMDRREFNEAKILVERLVNTTDKMLDIQKNGLLCELLFIELISECRKEEIERIYTSNLQKYVKTTSSYVAVQRLLYAYSKLFLNDDAEAAKILEKFNKICLTYPFDGEIVSNKELIKLVDILADKRKNQNEKSVII